MKNVKLLFVFLSFLLITGCSPSAKEKARSNTSVSKSFDTVMYDTIVMKSITKKTTINPRHHTSDDKINNRLGDTIIVTNTTGVLRERTTILKQKRVLRIVPNMELTSKNLTGRLNYIMSDTMEVGKVSIVEVSISRNMTKKMVINKVSTFRQYRNNISQITDTIIRVTPVMFVKLHEVGSKDNFLIDTITPTRQIIELEDTTLTVWQWKVTPLKDGSKILTLTVDLVIDGVEKNLTIYDGHIYVFMKHKFWVLIYNHFSKYWQWWCTAALFPILVWIFKTYLLPKFRKRKQNPEN